jgi:hypothetical protein
MVLSVSGIHHYETLVAQIETHEMCKLVSYYYYTLRTWHSRVRYLVLLRVLHTCIPVLLSSTSRVVVVVYYTTCVHFYSVYFYQKQ